MTDLSAYSVRFERGLTGWCFFAHLPGAEPIFGGGRWKTVEDAEVAALAVLERHSRGDLPINGEELRERVARRNQLDLEGASQ